MCSVQQQKNISALGTPPLDESNVPIYKSGIFLEHWSKVGGRPMPS